jgi:hypothetical protein
MKIPFQSDKPHNFSKKPDGIKFFFWVLIFAAVVLLLSPLLLGNSLFRDLVDRFTGPLEKEAYKEGYIGLIGGLIGSALGVVGALFVMHLERKKEMLYTIRVNARITFYDIELFYVEFSALARLFLKETLPELPQFIKQKEGLHLLINPNWISTVAELGDRVLDFDQVSRVYLIYGVMLRLDSVLQTFLSESADLQAEKLQEIRALFHQLGRLDAAGNFTYHIEAQPQAIQMGDVMDLLKKQIR